MHRLALAGDGTAKDQHKNPSNAAKINRTLTTPLVADETGRSRQ
jgi:hypothetical protein